MPEVQEVFRMATQKVRPDPGFLERQRRQQHRKDRNRKLGAIGVAAAIVGLAVVAVRVTMRDGGRQPADTVSITPSATPTPTGSAVSPPIRTAPWYSPAARSDVDYVVDLRNGQMTPLPEAITAALGNGKGLRPLERYAASPDGSMLAFVGTGEEGNPQIFIVAIDGTGLRQVTHDSKGAMSPAWSPDGALIAYVGYGADAGLPDIFVLDVATGTTRKVTVDGDDKGGGAWGPTFTPDGRSIIFDGGTNEAPELRTIPVDGGESRLLIGPGEGIDDAGNGALSPDGSLVTFLGGGEPTSGEVLHCGPCRLVANADGTGRRVIDGWMGTPAGIWSPDGSRIVTMEIGRAYANASTSPNFILVIDVETEEATVVANGRAAIWLDDHTLLVAV